MIDDERLKAVNMITEAKASVADALVTAKPDQVKPLKAVLHSLEEIETDLDVAFVDESFSELEEFREQLLELNEHLDKNDPDLKEPVRKVRSAGRELGLAIEAAKSIVKVPEKL